jgi:hypothetical protein
VYIDADNDECERFNDAEVLDTPIGVLRCLDWGGTICVAVMDPNEPVHVLRIVHQLAPYENPLSAVYGKRLLESPAIGRLYDRAAEVKTGSAAREHEYQRADFREAVRRFLGKYEDGREAVAERVGAA